MKPFPKIKVRAPAVIFFVLLWAFDGSLLSLAPVLAAVCHEFGHLFVMLLFGVPVREVEITLFGAEIRALTYSLGAVGRVCVYFAGAAANFACGSLVWAIFQGAPFAYLFFICSLGLGFFNLIPIRTLDGGCILEVICVRLFPRYASMVLAAVSALSLAVLWLSAVYLMLIFNGNLSLMLFCSYMFVSLYLRH